MPSHSSCKTSVQPCTLSVYFLASTHHFSEELVSKAWATSRGQKLKSSTLNIVV